jgi:uncharacterized protein
MTLRRKFSCISSCSDCCIYRQYYPSVAYGKIGVLILPEEKENIEMLAKKVGVKIKILPRIAAGRESPEKIIAYQMMGRSEDGDLCPFLETNCKDLSPHGGFKCKIYYDRPLACKAYPVVNLDRKKEAVLDEHCQFCRKHSITSVSIVGLQAEIESLAKIKSSVVADNKDLQIWRYATAIGREEDRNEMMPEGWIIEQ